MDLPPAHLTRTNDPHMPQCTAEWQGWSFVSPGFWTSAYGRNRTDFTKGSGVIAVADPDEWDDFNTGSLNGADFSTSPITPPIVFNVPAPQRSAQIGFDNFEATEELRFEVANVIDVENTVPIQNNIDELPLKDVAHRFKPVWLRPSAPVLRMPWSWPLMARLSLRRLMDPRGHAQVLGLGIRTLRSMTTRQAAVRRSQRLPVEL